MSKKVREDEFSRQVPSISYVPGPGSTRGEPQAQERPGNDKGGACGGKRAELGQGLDTGQPPGITSLSPFCPLLAPSLPLTSTPLPNHLRLLSQKPEGQLDSSYTLPSPPSLANSSTRVSFQATPSPLASLNHGDSYKSLLTSASLPSAQPSKPLSTQQPRICFYKAQPVMPFLPEVLAWLPAPRDKVQMP